MIARKAALGLVAVSLTAGCDRLGLGDKKKDPAGGASTAKDQADTASTPNSTAAATAAATTATTAAAPSLDPFVKQHLDVLQTAAGCASSGLEPWCNAAKDFANARPAAPKQGTLLGVATFVQTNGATPETLAKYTKVASFSVRSGTPPHALVADVKGDNPAEEAELGALRTQLFDHYAGKPVSLGAPAPLVAYLTSLVERAKYPMESTPSGYKLRGGSNADVRKVGDVWVAVEVPARNPAGIWINVFTEKSYGP